MLNNIKISVKMPALVVLSCIISCVALGVASFKIAEGIVHQAVTDEMAALLETREEALKGFFEGIAQDIRLTTANPEVISALKNFRAAWRSLPAELLQPISQQEYLQRLYITDNPHPDGEKEKLDAANDGTSYSRAHAQHHPWLRSLLQERDYYDIFLIDLSGNLIYSVFKELDYATNLNHGAYKDTDIANAFRDAAKAEAGELFFYDFVPYAPSADAPAGFISTPIFENGQRIGVLIFQTPIDRLLQLFAVGHWLGETGDTYVVGEDFLMRTDSRFDKESTILSKRIDNEAVRAGLAGETGYKVVETSYGYPAIESHHPFVFENIRWALIAEQAQSEAMQEVTDMRNAMLKVALIIVAVLGALGFLISSGIVRAIKRVVAVLQELAAGKEDVKIAGTERKDEVGDLARAAEVFAQNAQEAKQAEQRQREAEIRAEQEKKQAMLDMADRFENEVKGIVQMVAAAATQLSQTAEGVAASISQSTNMATETAAASEQASSNVQTVAAAAEELSASVQEISSQIARSNTLVRESVARTDAADAQAGSLSEATQRVREVVDLISDIAGKINLLSLNATIESARAGEAGKGFAVVASEVKSLANQTDRSIEEIVKVINDMNLASDDIITSLREIKSSINDISHSSGTVSAAVEEQSATTNELPATCKPPLKALTSSLPTCAW
jgi:methyl-accepting chemotaxis protein